MNVLAEVNKSHNENLLKMIPYRKFKALQSIYTQLPYKKLAENQTFQIPLKNNQTYRVYTVNRVYMLYNARR